MNGSSVSGTKEPHACHPWTSNRCVGSSRPSSPECQHRLPGPRAHRWVDAGLWSRAVSFSMRYSDGRTAKDSTGEQPANRHVLLFLRSGEVLPECPLQLLVNEEGI